MIHVVNNLKMKCIMFVSREIAASLCVKYSIKMKI